MSFTLCASGAIVAKAGAYVSAAAAASGVLLARWSDDAEGKIVTTTRRDWITKYSDIASGVKLALADCCSDLAAIKLVAYDIGGYIPGEALTIVNILKDNSREIMTALKDFDSNEIKDPS